MPIILVDQAQRLNTALAERMKLITTVKVIFIQPLYKRLFHIHQLIQLEIPLLNVLNFNSPGQECLRSKIRKSDLDLRISNPINLTVWICRKEV